MKKRVGRPKVGTQNAKKVFFSARFTTPEAKQINEAIQATGQRKPDWIRQALLSAANGGKSGP